MPNQSIPLASFEAIPRIGGSVPIGIYGLRRNRPGPSTTKTCHGCVSLETQQVSFPFARNREYTLGSNPRPRTAQSFPATAGRDELWKTTAHNYGSGIGGSDQDDIPDEDENVSRRKKRAKADDEAHDDAADGDEDGDEDDDDDAGDDGDDDGDDGCGYSLISDDDDDDDGGADAAKGSIYEMLTTMMMHMQAMMVAMKMTMTMMMTMITFSRRSIVAVIDQTAVIN